jgi:hypothetical protein
MVHDLEVPGTRVIRFSVYFGEPRMWNSGFAHYRGSSHSQNEHHARGELSQLICGER